jgi:ubiquinone/menaquinone biosynthesis C-methylase UbiE
MLTDDNSITTPEYWNGLYEGKRNNAPIDSSNGVRKSTFDRFSIVADLVEGPKVLEVAAGHARISSMVKGRHKDWEVMASDQSTAALKASGFTPYRIYSVYNIPLVDKFVSTLICTQAMEYFQDLNRALTEFKRVSKRGVFTFPKGEMGSWSQLYIFTPESVMELLAPYGTIEIFEVFDHLILAKINFA